MSLFVLKSVLSEYCYMSSPYHPLSPTSVLLICLHGISFPSLHFQSLCDFPSKVSFFWACAQCAAVQWLEAGWQSLLPACFCFCSCHSGLGPSSSSTPTHHCWSAKTWSTQWPLLRRHLAKVLASTPLQRPRHLFPSGRGVSSRLSWHTSVCRWKKQTRKRTVWKYKKLKLRVKMGYSSRSSFHLLLVQDPVVVEVGYTHVLLPYLMQITQSEIQCGVWGQPLFLFSLSNKDTNHVSEACLSKCGGLHQVGEPHMVWGPLGLWTFQKHPCL